MALLERPDEIAPLTLGAPSEGHVWRLSTPASADLDDDWAATSVSSLAPRADSAPPPPEAGRLSEPELNVVTPLRARRGAGGRLSKKLHGSPRDAARADVSLPPSRPADATLARASDVDKVVDDVYANSIDTSRPSARSL